MKKILTILLCAMLLMTTLCAPYVLAEATEPPASPAAPAPVTYTVNLTGLIIAILVAFFEFLLAWLLKAVIPPAKRWLDSHTTKNQQTVMWNVAKRLVEAAEQIITGEGKGDEKLAWVEAQLRHYGYGFDRYVIEAAVKEMNDRSLAVIAEELDIPGEKQEKTEDE